MKKQLIIFFLLVLVLFIFNKILMNGLLYNASIVDTQGLVNKEQTSSQKLFDRAWGIIKNNFYETYLNEQ